MLENLSAGFVELKREQVLETVQLRLDQGEGALDILNDARSGMTAVGDGFQEGTLYLAEMMLAAEIFKDAVAILKPALEKSRPPGPLGRVVLVTPRGDIHDLGKNIVGTLLEGQGFQVFDLGVDADPDMVVNKVKEVEPDFVGFSALITTAFASMKEITDIFEQEKMRDSFSLMVGGGVTSPMVKDHINADFQTTDAMEGVVYCVKAMELKKSA